MHLAASGHHLGLGPGSHGEGPKTRRAAEALLAAAVGEINLPVVDVKGHTTEGGDRVEQQQAVVLAAEVTDASHRLTDAGGCFGVNHRQDGRLVLDQCGLKLLKREPLSPGFLDRFHITAIATGHVRQAKTEIALHSHQDGVTGFDRVGQGGFHGSTARATHWQRQPVVGLPGVAQKLLHFPHQLHIKRIEMADRGAGQRFQNRGMGVGGAWPQQQTIRRVDRGEGLAMSGIDLQKRIRRRQGPDWSFIAGSLRSHVSRTVRFKSIARKSERRLSAAAHSFPPDHEPCDRTAPRRCRDERRRHQGPAGARRSPHREARCCGRWVLWARQGSCRCRPGR